jgi:hypothetical protein
MHTENLQGHDWNEGEPDHEGEMAVSQLHRMVEMAEMLLNIIGEDDDLPGWVQYKLGRAYSDLNDAFGYIESKSHDLHDHSVMSADESMAEGKKKKPGLWANIRARRRAGKRPHRPGEKGYPDAKTWKKLTSESLKTIIRDLVEKELKG